MIIFYRMCGIPSTSEPPIYSDNKLKLNEVCLRSFVDAYREIKPKMVFINDYCDLPHIEMIKKYCPFEMEMVNTQIGINESCLLQYKMYEKEKDDVVLFQECDYIHRKPLTESMIQSLLLVSPYDHPDKYNNYVNGFYKSFLQLEGGSHFRSIPSTTSTFACTKKVFNSIKEILYKYGYIDKERWEEILRTKFHDLKYTLWSPIPSFATHMLIDWMAPNIDWESIWKKYEK